MKSQGILFSEPSCAETAVWCELSDGIDPAKWAYLCRHIGRLGIAEFENISAMLLMERKTKNSGVFSGFKRFLKLKIENLTDMPIISLGTGKPGGEYQWER
jgi:hypothetical protein